MHPDNAAPTDLLEDALMDLIQLRQRLDAEGVNPGTYSLNEGIFDNRYHLETSGEEWRFFFFERGAYSSERTFGDEKEATEYFLHEILRDGAVRY